MGKMTMEVMNPRMCGKDKLVHHSFIFSLMSRNPNICILSWSEGWFIVMPHDESQPNLYPILKSEVTKG